MELKYDAVLHAAARSFKFALVKNILVEAVSASVAIPTGQAKLKRRIQAFVVTWASDIPVQTKNKRPLARLVQGGKFGSFRLPRLRI